ncbi:hypothetical protein HGA34_04785 [Candidatus Falkowbacteria bacterium]|nr:hypothetical protein [Candidatus Falkowbacteria bacterium]
MFGSSPLRNRPTTNNPNKPWTSTYLSKNLQGKEFVGHSAFKRFREQIGKFTGTNKLANTGAVKQFIKQNFSGKKAYQVNDFLKLRLKMNEAQREKVIGEISPSGGLTKEQQRTEERLGKVRQKDNIYEAQKMANSHLAKSETTHIMAGQSANVTTGFAGKGTGPQKSGFASGPAGNVAPLTRTDGGVASGGQSNSTPSRPYFQP